MSYKDTIKYGIDENGELTMTAIDFKDHKGMDPHAHDVDVNKPFSDYDNARGEARPLTSEERKEFSRDIDKYYKNQR